MPSKITFGKIKVMIMILLVIRNRNLFKLTKASSKEISHFFGSLENLKAAG